MIYLDHSFLLNVVLRFLSQTEEAKTFFLGS